MKVPEKCLSQCDACAETQLAKARCAFGQHTWVRVSGMYYCGLSSTGRWSLLKIYTFSDLIVWQARAGCFRIRHLSPELDPSTPYRPMVDSMPPAQMALWATSLQCAHSPLEPVFRRTYMF